MEPGEVNELLKGLKVVSVDEGYTPWWMVINPAARVICRGVSVPNELYWDFYSIFDQGEHSEELN